MYTSVFLGIDDFFAVFSELLPVADEWKKIGLALRLRPNLLNVIRDKKYSDAQYSLSDVLTEWLNKTYKTAEFGDPSWKLIVAAVAHEAGGNDYPLAVQIAERHSIPKPAPATTSYPTSTSISVPTYDKIGKHDLVLQFCFCKMNKPFLLLDDHDFFTVYTELRSVAYKWREIGLALRLHPHTLEKISYYYTCKCVDDRLIEMLTVWLNKAYNTAQPSWTLVVAAVAHPAGGDNRALAEHIANKYGVRIIVPASMLPTILTLGKPAFV